ncbi:MAG: hypothetical protein E2598_06485 [Sphingobium sp.]|nr:hypothetical protein [Sphingobium sp.]
MGGIPPFFAGGGGVKAKSATVEADTTGVVHQLRAGLTAPITWSRLTGPTRFGVAASGGVSVNPPLAAGESISAVVRGVSGSTAVEFPQTLTGQAPAPNPEPGEVIMDWRAIATAVTDLSGAALPDLAGQQTAPTDKARSAYINSAAVGDIGVVYHVDAHDTDLILSWWAATAQLTFSVLIDGVDTGFVELKPSSTTSISGRRQFAVIPAGAAKTIALVATRASGTSSIRVYPLLHKLPLNGKAPIFAGFGNSLTHYSLGDGTTGFESAMQAAVAGSDPLWLNFGLVAANVDTISAAIGRVVADPRSALINCVHLFGIIGANVSSSRPYTAGQAATLSTKCNAAIDTCEAAGWRVIFDEVSYRPYTPDAPAEDPATQTNGSGPYNQAVIWPIIRDRYPDQWDDTYQMPRTGTYLYYLYRRGWIGDGTHPSEAYWAGFQAHHAASWYIWVLTGLWSSPQIEQRIATVEDSFLQSDYDEVTYALVYAPTSAAKTAIINRQVAVYPLVLLKTANLAVIEAETYQTSETISAAQDALDLAVAGGAPTANMAGLAGTTALQARIDALDVLTVTRRLRINLGAAASAATYDATNNTATGQLVLRDFAGAEPAATDIILGYSPANSTSTVNGVQQAVGVAPNDFSGSEMRTYIGSNTSGIWACALCGLRPDRKYRFYLASARAGSSDRSMRWTVRGVKTLQSAIINPAGVSIIAPNADDSAPPIGPITPVNGAAFTASASAGSATLTVAAVTSGLLAIGQVINHPAFPAGTKIIGQPAAQTGAYTCDQPATVAAAAVTPGTSTGWTIAINVTNAAGNTSSTFVNGIIVEELD